jgi:hypothetical protein
MALQSLWTLATARRKAATYTHTHTHTQTQNKCAQTSMPRMGFEPTIPVFKRPKTVYALDRAATVIRSKLLPPWKSNNAIQEMIMESQQIVCYITEDRIRKLVNLYLWVYKWGNLRYVGRFSWIDFNKSIIILFKQVSKVFSPLRLLIKIIFAFATDVLYKLTFRCSDHPSDGHLSLKLPLTGHCDCMDVRRDESIGNWVTRTAWPVCHFCYRSCSAVAVCAGSWTVARVLVSKTLSLHRTRYWNSTYVKPL